MHTLSRHAHTDCLTNAPLQNTQRCLHVLPIADSAVLEHTRRLERTGTADKHQQAVYTCMGDDSNVEEYLDPELDQQVSNAAAADREPVPGPFSLSQIVLGAHVFAAAGISLFIWPAFRNGNVPQVVTLLTLVCLLLVAGVYTRRVAKRREP